MKRHRSFEDDWECVRVCGAPHPYLSVQYFCREAAGHAGSHVIRDGCGRALHAWTTGEPTVDREERR